MATDQNSFEHFTLLKFLEEGAFGAVYKARNNKSRQIVAVKLFKNRYREEEAFFSERVSHPNIVQVYNFAPT